MKRIHLTPRLQMTAELVPRGARLADIGTDHAYLPAALLLEGKIPFAIVSDLRQGPLERARATVRACGLYHQTAFRLCDGLRGFRREELDAAVIAGMGGETIAEILENAPWTSWEGFALVLQPMSSMPELRGRLREKGFCIAEERLAREGDTLYTALLVRAGEMPPMTPAELWAGRNSPDPLRGDWLELWLVKTRRALEGVSQSSTPAALARRGELEEVSSGLEEMKKEWKRWQL